jgi:protein TonB
MSTRHLIFAVALAVMLTPAALLAAKKKSTTAPPPAPPPAPARADTAVTRPMLIPVTVTPGSVSRTPGPTIKPGSPIEDRTTIAPFPMPGDTSRAAIARAKLMNVPREGVTALEPLPPSPGTQFNGSWWKGLFVPNQGGSITPPEHVDVLPEQLMAPAPVYPKAAIDAGIQGIVPVMARVLADGTVGETHVMRSIPALDDAAVQAVKRMRFKPASYQGKPVAAWVGVPVRFTIH